MEALRIRAVTSDGTLLGEADVQNNGNFSIEPATNYVGTVILEAFDTDPASPDYIDERSRTRKSLSTSLRAVVTKSSDHLFVNINPVTDIAARRIDAASEITDSAIAKSNAEVARAFGLPDDFVTGDSPKPVVKIDGSLVLGKNDRYGNILAAISGAEKNSNTYDVIEGLAQGIGIAM